MRLRNIILLILLLAAIYMLDPFGPRSNEKYAPLVNEVSKYTKPYNLYSGKQEYRLGDMVIWPIWRKHSKGESYHYKHFPDSIASEYMRKTTESNKHDVLFNIIKNSIVTLPPNTLVIHLRTGDVIEKCKYSITEMLSTEDCKYCLDSLINYIKPVSYYTKKLEQLKQVNPYINNIIIVSGSHLDIPTYKSSLYINCIKKILENQNYNVSLRLGNDPDEDFIFMSSADYLLPSTGGYGKLISAMVKKSGGIVV